MDKRHPFSASCKGILSQQKLKLKLGRQELGAGTPGSLFQERQTHFPRALKRSLVMSRVLRWLSGVGKMDSRGIRNSWLRNYKTL